MTLSARKIGIAKLLKVLSAHHDRLEKHCERTEVLGEKLREGIKTLDETYKRLKWWIEFRRRLEFLRVNFSVFLEKKEQRTEEYQQTLTDLMLHYRYSTTGDRWNPSDAKQKEEDLSKFVEDLQKYNRSIEKNLRTANLGMFNDATGNFKGQLSGLSSMANRRIEKLAEEIGEIAGGLQWGEHK